MFRVFLLFCFTTLIPAHGALSQTTSEVVWVQIEAQPSLTVAQERARIYAGDLQDVNGFAVGGGWYAIALGPYTRADAQRVLNVYRSERLIPRDSYITDSDVFRSQFWPVGSDLLTAPAETAEAGETGEASQEPAANALAAPSEPTAAAEPAPQPVDETPREARASESRLTKSERQDLQIWLQWTGDYNAAIDGAFGRGTRRSMEAWQARNGFEPTGVLTTLQRETLRRQYFAVLDGMDLRRVTVRDAGIEMLVPMGVVSQADTEFPFVRFAASGEIPAQVVLISQAGDQNTLFGLYDIMQTLEIVPLEGERSRKSQSFELSGRNAQIVSYTEASLKNGEIKGFTLVWPVGDEERRKRLLDEMKASFTRLDGVLDPAAGSNAEQSIDLMSGLEIRKPKLSRSGFFVDAAGTVVTAAEVVKECARVTLENTYPAEVIATDADLGVAILQPSERLSPMRIANLRAGDARLQSEIAVSGYSYEGVLGAPTMTFGTLSDVKGLHGEPELKRLAMAAQPGDAGGPVLDPQGSVMGMLLPKMASNGQQLPDTVNFALGSDSIRALLGANGLAAGQAPQNGAQNAAGQAPEDLTRMGSEMTVLVSCWN